MCFNSHIHPSFSGDMAMCLGDKGIAGIKQFCQQHVCNSICKGLGLEGLKVGSEYDSDLPDDDDFLFGDEITKRKKGGNSVLFSIPLESVATPDAPNLKAQTESERVSLDALDTDDSSNTRKMAPPPPPAITLVASQDKSSMEVTS